MYQTQLQLILAEHALTRSNSTSQKAGTKLQSGSILRPLDTQQNPLKVIVRSKLRRVHEDRSDLQNGSAQWK
jgi:hypothetical protein